MKRLMRIGGILLAGGIPLALFYYYKITIAKVNIGSYHDGFLLGVLVSLLIIVTKKYNDKLKE